MMLVVGAVDHEGGLADDLRRRRLPRVALAVGLQENAQPGHQAKLELRGQSRVRLASSYRPTAAVDRMQDARSSLFFFPLVLTPLLSSDPFVCDGYFTPWKGRSPGVSIYKGGKTRGVRGSMGCCVALNKAEQG